jgi:phenylacetate-coenzyme A ligase PaaK-like adenylate-forming protein
MDNLDPTTTLEQDRKLALNRKLDFLVEITQTALALGITAVMAYLAIKGLKNEDVSNSFFLIVGFYFGKQFKDGATKLGLTILDISKNGTKTFQNRD